MIKKPILYDKNMAIKGVLSPAEISVTQNIRPLSIATMQFYPHGVQVEGLDFIQLFFPDGTSEYYRAKTTAEEHGGLMVVALEHGIVWLEDFICTEKVSFEGTPRELLEKLLSYANTKWAVGKVECETDVKVDIDYTNVMQGVADLLDLCDGYMYSLDQSGETWYIDLVKQPEDDGCEGRLSRNIANAVVNVDFRDFATRLYVPGRDWYVDSDTIEKWGLRENVLLANDSSVSDDELREQCEKYFKKNKDPKVSVNVEARELARITGQNFDDFTVGKVCRLCFADYGGAVIRERVNSRTYPQLVSNPDFVILGLASHQPDASSAINGLSVTLKTLKTKTETKLADVWQGIKDIDGVLTAEINKVSIELDAERARIDLKADQTQVTDLSTELKSAQVAIDAANAEIALKAEKTAVDNLTGQMTELETTVTVNVDGLRTSIQKGDKTIAELKATVDGLEHWVTDADGNVAELTNTVRGLESKVTTADDKVSILTNTADGLTSTILGQGGDLAQFKTRIDEISAGVKDTNGSIGTLSVKADSVTAKVKGVEGQVSQLAVTADGLNYTLQRHGEELSSIRAVIDEISLTVKDANGAMGQLSVKSDSIAGKLKDANGKLTALQELTEDRFRVVLGDIEVVEGDIKTITGSTLWQTRDSITGVVGKIEIDANGNVVIKQGSGLRVYENGTSVGVYNENNLTAGLLVQKINGSTTAKIKADVIELDGHTIVDLLTGMSMDVLAITSTDAYIAYLESESINTGKIVANEMYIADGTVATQEWVNGRYNTMKIWVEANYATHGWTVDHFVQSTALTTETVKVLTSASFSATGEIAVRDADGKIIGTALTGGKVTYGTTEITYVKYA